MINDLAKINLNLLVALDVLLKEKHVTNAGKRLHITQKNSRGCFHKNNLFSEGW
jgi:hypothetical protein